MSHEKALKKIISMVNDGVYMGASELAQVCRYLDDDMTITYKCHNCNGDSYEVDHYSEVTSCPECGDMFMQSITNFKLK